MYGALGAACHTGPAAGLQTAALPSASSLSNPSKSRSSLLLRALSEADTCYSTSSGYTDNCEIRSQQKPGRASTSFRWSRSMNEFVHGTQSSVLGCSSIRKHSSLPSLLPAPLRWRSLNRKLRSIQESSLTEVTSDETNEHRLEVTRRAIAADAAPVDGEETQVKVQLRVQSSSSSSSPSSLT